MGQRERGNAVATVVLRSRCVRRFCTSFREDELDANPTAGPGTPQVWRSTLEGYPLAFEQGPNSGDLEMV